VDLDNERIVGVEALVRWDHPRQGLLLPESFLDMATALGLATAIDLQVLETAVAQLGRWRRGCSGGENLFVSVNLSPSALLDPRLVSTIDHALSKADVPPAALAVEVTEQTVAAGPGDVANRIHELRALGLRIALDDFGTGYSSLSRLMELPVDVLKIDRAFSQSLPGSGDQRNLASYVVELGRICELTTVAEGVETRAQANILRQHGCTFAQGFLFADPLPVDRIAPLLVAGPYEAVLRDPEDVAGR
jgi:EAL domain-containing protein (putative c-di-GMP-specific phosphodiesterase class I)